MQTWIEDVRKNAKDKCVIMIIGSKSDVDETNPEARKVTLEEGAAFAKSLNISFFETSSKQASNITSTFETISEKILQIAEEDTEYLGKLNMTFSSPNKFLPNDKSIASLTSQLSPLKDVFLVQGAGGNNDVIVDLGQKKTTKQKNGCC